MTRIRSKHHRAFDLINQMPLWVMVRNKFTKRDHPYDPNCVCCKPGAFIEKLDPKIREELKEIDSEAYKRIRHETGN